MDRIQSPSFFIGRDGEGIISFGSGQPDLSPPDEVYKILPDYHDFKYGLIRGLPKLREALCAEYPGTDMDQFVVTNGASEALDLVLRALSRRGKDILIPKPYYYSYPFNVRYVGMEAHTYDLVDGKIDLDSLKKKLKRKFAILINSPSNPAGSVQDMDVLKEIEAITQREGIYVISDEVYKDLIYGRSNYLIAGPRVITINSFSKTYAMCGFRVGYLFARDPVLIEEIVEMKTHTSMNTNILGQEMAFEATRVPEKYNQDQVAIWKDRRDIIYQGLVDLGFSLWKPEGAFYVLPRVKDSNRVVNELYRKHKVIVYDGNWFGAPDRIRFSYALDKPKILEGLERIKKYLEEAGNPQVFT